MKKTAFFLMLAFLFLAGGCAEKSAKPERKGTQAAEEDQIEQVKALIEQGLLKQAEKRLGEILKQNPEDLKALALMGKIYYGQRNYKQSLQYFEKLTELGEEKAGIYYQIGNNYYQLKNYFSAMQNYKRVIQLDPLITEAYLRVGDIYLEWRDFTQAANWYNKAIKIEKKAAGTYYSLAKLQFEMNQYDRALTILKQVFEINPYDFEGRILELRILDQKEDKDSLFKKTKVFVKDFPDKSEGFLFLGKVYLDWEKYRQAFEHYQKAIEVAPEMASSYNGMGNYYYERKEYGKARELYQKSLKLNPNYSHVYFNLGLVEWKEQKFAAAQKNFVQAYELNKWFKEAIFFSSICSMESGKPEEALNYLVNFYMKDAFLYYTNLRNPEYGPQMGRILQNFWKYNDRNDKFNRGLYVALVDSKGKALYLLKDDQNPKAMYVVARLYFLQNENEKGKQVFLNYLKKDNASREIILLDYSFNNVKGEPWFLKALEELQ